MEHSASKMKCPKCDTQLDRGFLYVRGLGASIFWSTTDRTRFYSRKALSQLDLGRLSKTPVGAQAVVPAFRCAGCGMAMFETQ